MASDQDSPVPAQRLAGSMPSLPGIPDWVGDQDAAVAPAASDEPSRLRERLLAARRTG